VPLTFLSAAYVLGLSKRKAREGKKKRTNLNGWATYYLTLSVSRPKALNLLPKKKRLNALIPLGLFGDLQDSTST
jgi:hypothetical protein